MTARKPFAAERLACNRILRKVAHLWRRYEPELKRCVREGKYEAEMHLRQRAYREQDRLYREWMAIRKSMPPFVDRRGSIVVLLPITPENVHQLTPQYLAPLTGCKSRSAGSGASAARRTESGTSTRKRPSGGSFAR